MEGVLDSPMPSPSARSTNKGGCEGVGGPRMGNSRSLPSSHRPLSESERRGGKVESRVCPGPSPEPLWRRTSGKTVSHFSLT